jgi:hypothetical protein
MYENRYDMTREENVFYAKRGIIDSIWKEANLEGIDVTYPDTAEIFEGRAVAGLSIKSTIAINNLKRAWRYNLENIDIPLDFRMLKEFNQIIGQPDLFSNPGMVRLTDVRIGGTKWQPPIPNEQLDKPEFEELLSRTPAPEVGLDIMCWACRKQLFSDGNKRTAQLAANHYLVANGYGILAVPLDVLSEFRTKLTKFYETNKSMELKQFLYDECMDGTDFSADRECAKMREAGKELDIPFQRPQQPTTEQQVPESTNSDANKAAEDYTAGIPTNMDDIIERYGDHDDSKVASGTLGKMRDVLDTTPATAAGSLRQRGDSAAAATRRDATSKPEPGHGHTGLVI